MDMRTGLDTDFNPRSRTGSDCGEQVYHKVHQNFNPRSRTGSDTSVRLPGWEEKISTHAPAQGATK